MASKNPEVEYARKNGIVIKSYPEAVGEFLVKPHSIVATGTWGKTTSSALLTHILKHANMHPSYMIGGVNQDGSPSSAIDTGEWSVVEGDEYTSAKWDSRAKFMHYRPTHLLVTAVRWDHADVYPTEESYFDAFKKLFTLVPKTGLVVACIDREKLPELLDEVKREYISYGKSEGATYRYENVRESPHGIEFDIDYHGKTYHIKSPLLGSYNAENVTGCFAMAREVGIAPSEITDAIQTFHGVKRRLEKRYENEVTVIDDIAHSAEKVKSVLKTLRAVYRGKIAVVYEPNSGNRTPQSKPQYDGAFKDADEVVIPRLTKLKLDEKKPEKTFDGDELAEIISECHPRVSYIDDDQKLVEYVTRDRKPGDVIAFLGSHGFRGMIEETVKKLAGK